MTMTEVTSLVMAAVLCMMGQVSPMSLCGVDSIPHSGGFCGPQLTKLRNDFCLLLSHDYPDFFATGKRSVDIFDLPMEAFAKMALHDDNPSDGDDFSDFTLPPKISNKFAFPSLRSSKSRSTSRALVAKRGNVRELSSVEKRGLVCDCCYNECLPSVLGRYC